MTEENKKPNTNNVSFKVISPNQKVENDKERIKSKFNFNISRTSTNSSAHKKQQSSFTTQQNSCLFSDKLQKIKRKIMNQNNQIININRPFSTQKAKKSTQKIKQSSNNKKSNFYNHSKEKEKNSYSNYNKSSQNQSQINENILSNITYNNYDKYYFDNSSFASDIQKNLLIENILKTQTIEEDVKCNKINDSKTIFNQTKNDLDIRIENENDDGTKTLKDNEIFKSLNNSSFSGSSKTSEINRGNFYLKNEENCSNGDNIEINNNNNYIIRNYKGFTFNKPSNNFKAVSTGETFLQQLFKPYKKLNFERRRTEVNDSLLDDDDYNKESRQKMLKNVSKYYFIEDIIKKHNNYISLSFIKFKELNNNVKYRIFSFVFDNYKNFLNSSKIIRNIILNMLQEKYGNCIDDFKNRYKNIFNLENYKYNVHNVNNTHKSNKIKSKFCLYLKVKILPKNIFLKKYGDIGFEISYKYKVRNLKNEYNKRSFRTNMSSQSYISKDHINEEFIQIYKFDLRKNVNYPIWICSEREELSNNTSKTGGINLLSRILKKDELFQKHFIYSSPIINVNENDFIIFRIDLIDNNIIENIKFNNIIIESIYNNYFHKNYFKLEQKFDNMRDCENEIIINIWHDECAIKEYCTDNTLVNYQNFIFKLKQYFKEYFEIIETKFDMSKYIFIRMRLKAKKIGILKNSVFSNKDIKIVDKNTSLTKECIPINLVNSFSMNKYLIIKQDTIVDFYFIE